jgi:lactoylglutathione lyase
MRTLHVGLRVSNLDPSLAFYRAVGYTVTGTVEGTPFGNLTMLQLPGDPSSPSSWSTTRRKAK